MSKEDFDSGESNSIVHQKEILAKYARDRGFGNTKFFVEDGVSGSLFSRPWLDALLAEVRTGGVATVIIKDQSRIGRDVIEVGLLKRTFDEYDVRLIAAKTISTPPTVLTSWLFFETYLMKGLLPTRAKKSALF